MEWNFHNKKSQSQIEWKWNGNRMVMERKKMDKPIGSKIYWNGTEMERKQNGDII